MSLGPENDSTTDGIAPFDHDREAALCRRLLGDRAHGLDTLIEGP